MKGQLDPEKFTQSTSLNNADKKEIDDLVAYTLNDVQLLMIKIGGLTNMLAAIFVAFVLYGKVSTTLLVGWNLALLALNIMNVSFSMYFKHRKVDPSQMAPWRNTYRFILGTLCFTWGIVGVLFTSDLQYQLYTMTFLQIALVGFSFGTITDFTASLVATICVMTPYIAFRVFSAVHHTGAGYDTHLNLAFSISLAILGVFLLAVSFVGYRLIKNFFKLSFVNVALSKKLENMNQFLEKRVKERTIELENSLKLVTYQSMHDLLTDLPNQRLFMKYIRSAIKISNQNNQMFAVISFSINEIERINDALGHQTGEVMIQTVTKRFNKLLDKLDETQITPLELPETIVSLSRKDVFIILVQPVIPEEVKTRVESFFSILKEPIYIGKQAITLSASIGVCLYPIDGREMTSLLMNSDAAMLKAKQRGGNSLNIYEAEINADFTRQLEVESYLHAALKNNELSLVYQPFIDAKTHRICGLEALIRWKNPVLGFVSPVDFIPIAVANGLIIPIGEWILRTACKQASEWHKQGFTSLKISVNLASKQLLDKNIMKMIAEILEENSLDPAFLELELTETEAFQADVIPILNQANEMGLCLSIDDFGMGYSGLSNLKLFAIDKLKIDKSFVDDVITNNDSKAIVTNTINLAKKLNVIALAEGVETKEQLDFLRDNGCDLIQGYYFSPAVSASDFTKLLENDKSQKTQKA
jgi:diguanylate cyclase (GGDEF)-like protein